MCFASFIGKTSNISIVLKLCNGNAPSDFFRTTPPLQLYHREDARSNSLPPEVLHSSVYQPPLRERFNSLDSNYCTAGEHRAALHRVSVTLLLFHLFFVCFGVLCTAKSHHPSLTFSSYSAHWEIRLQ